jgi:CBS domain containing-hemolysin-like protein
VTSSRRSQLEPLANDGVRGAKQAMYALEHVSLMLAISQLGITVMSTSLGAIAEPAICTPYLSPRCPPLGWAWMLHTELLS